MEAPVLITSVDRALQFAEGYLHKFDQTHANSLPTGMDRAFGALADALGLATTRTMFDNVRALAEAEYEWQLALAGYLGVSRSAVGNAPRLAVARLAEVTKKGEIIDSPLGLLRVWTLALGQAMHSAMQSGDGIAATARLVRATTEHQLRLENLIALAADAVGLVTRRDLDEAYREIQLLKRQMRSLRRDRATNAAPAKRKRASANGSAIATREQA
jgi:Poly(R)-hydroxyalkanoic acid synthase subunit (PHA_synth_III_E)